MGHCTAHQQQLLMGARAISHQLSVQLARERTLSKQLLTAAMAQADTAAAYLQQVSLLQQAGLVREGGGATLVAEGQAVRQGAIAVEIDGEVAAIAAQLTLLKQQLQRFNCAEEVLSQMEGERNAAQQQVQELSAQLQQQTSSAEQGVSGFVRSLSELMNQKDSAQLQVQQLSAELQQQASCAAQALSGVMAERDSSQQQVQQLQQQVSSAEQVVGRVITERDTAQLQVQQLSAELQQQQASSSEELSKVLRERDAAQLQVQQLSTQLQQVQGQLTNCQQELVEVRAAVPSPEQLQQYYQYYQGYQALCAAYQEQAAQLQGATSERDGLSQQLGQTQQQLQQVTGERDSFAQQLQVITTERDSNQQQLVEVQQQLAACQAEKRRLEVFERQLGRVEEQLGRAEAELVQEKEHRDKEREKGEMLVSALNQVLATAAPGQVVGVGSLGPRVGAGAQGEVKQVWLDLALHGGVTTQQALAQGLTPPRSADDWWGEPTVMKLGDAAKCAQEVAITAVATLKGAANGVYLGPKLRYVELGGVGQKPQLYLEMWSCDLWQLLTHVSAAAACISAGTLADSTWCQAKGVQELCPVTPLHLQSSH
jgi:chromosome segregation ATPase